MTTFLSRARVVLTVGFAVSVVWRSSTVANAVSIVSASFFAFSAMALKGSVPSGYWLEYLGVVAEMVYSPSIVDIWLKVAIVTSLRSL